jgi:fermentation-respiration switch protein FrsA (DUF1100 family)
MPFLKYFTFLCHQQWPSEKNIQRIVNTPILFLSGAKDELVPPPHMVKLHELNESRAENTWVAFPNGMHNDTCMQPGYFTAIKEYLEKSVLKEEKPSTLDQSTLDQSYVDGKLVDSENDQAYQLVSGVTDEKGMAHSFQVEEIELDEE